MKPADSCGNSGVAPHLVRFLPPCQVRCPLHEDIQRTNVLISLLPSSPHAADKKIIEIGDYIFSQNPFFTICAYVCGICELECSYSDRGGAIRRRLLKRFIAERYRSRLSRIPPFPAGTREKVAVIGGGPAGLMAAFHLSRLGYRTTIFESSDKLGGALQLIPHYRLPPETLAEALDSLVRISGTDIRINSTAGEGGIETDQLLKEGFHAVFIATGSPTPRILTYGGREVPVRNLQGVIYGHSFLYEIAHQAIPEGYFNDKRVLVVGGGNVAFDAARSAKRLGARTALVCLEGEGKVGKDSLPADPHEVRGAIEEGVEIIYSRGASIVNSKNGVFTGITAPRCIRVYDGNGFNPQFDSEDTIEIPAEFLIVAVSQGPERNFLLHEGLLDNNGKVNADPVTLQSTANRHIFIGGDMLRIGFMADAIRDGLVAAESIDRFIRGEDLKEGRTIEYYPTLPPERHLYRKEPPLSWTPPEQRLNFNIFEKGFTLDEAIAEAKRCLACGPCASCRACIAAGIQKDIPQMEVIEELCSGCGICVAACPYGAASLITRNGRVVSFTESILCRGCGLCVPSCPAAARRLITPPSENKG